MAVKTKGWSYYALGLIKILMIDGIHYYGRSKVNSFQDL